MPGHSNTRVALLLVGPKSNLQHLAPAERPNQMFFANDTHELWEADPPSAPTGWRLVLRSFSERILFLVAPVPIEAHVPDTPTVFLDAPWLGAAATFASASIEAQVVLHITGIGPNIPPTAQARAEYSPDAGVTWLPLGENGGPTASLTAVGNVTGGFEKVDPNVLGGVRHVRLVYENGGNTKVDFGRATLLLRSLVP